MEEECAVGDFLGVGADPGVEDGDHEEQDWDLAWKPKESGFGEVGGVVGEVPTGEDDDRGGDCEGEQDSTEGPFEILEIPELFVVEGWVES